MALIKFADRRAAPGLLIEMKVLDEEGETMMAEDFRVFLSRKDLLP